MIRRLTIGAGALLLLSGVALAQTSTSWKVEEYSFNSGGGVPSQVTVLTSTSFSVTLAAHPERAAHSGVPTSGGTFYYLVTVKTRLAEEETKGLQSDTTTERVGSFDLLACP